MLQLRPATIDDLPTVRYWDTKPHVIASDPAEDNWDWSVELARTPPWREQLIATLDDRPLAFVQIIDPHREETGYWGQMGPNKRAVDIWIGEESDLGKGYGTIVMSRVIERIFSHPTVTGILVDPLKSNTRACRFYRKLGFQFVEDRDFDGDRCSVFELPRPSPTPRNS